MKPALTYSEVEALILDLLPLPEEVLADLLAFGGLGEEERRAMRLDRRGFLRTLPPSWPGCTTT